MSTGPVTPSGRPPESPKKLEASSFYKKQNGEWVSAEIPAESKKMVEKLLGDIKEIGSQIASFQEFKERDREYEVTGGSIIEKGKEINVLNKEELEEKRAEINKAIEDIARTLHVEPSEFKLTAKVAFDPYQKILEEAKSTANGMKKSIENLEFIEQNKQSFYRYLKEEGGNPAFWEKCSREGQKAKAAVEDFSKAMDEVEALAKRGRKKEAIETYARVVTEKLPNLVEKVKDFALLMDEAGVLEKKETPYLNAFRKLCREKGVDEKGVAIAKIQELLAETQQFSGIFSKFFQNPLKYPLLTRELLKNTDAGQQQLLETTQAKTEKIASELNEYKRVQERREHRLSGSFFEPTGSPSHLFEDLRFKNNLNKNNLARKDIRAFGEISDRYAKVINSLNVQLDNLVKETDPYQKAILRDRLREEAHKELSELNKLTAKFEKWGGRKKIRTLIEAVKTYGDQTESSLRTNLRNVPGYVYDESKSANENYLKAFKSQNKYAYNLSVEANLAGYVTKLKGYTDYVTKLKGDTNELIDKPFASLPAYVAKLSKEERESAENALLLATLDYLQVEANQKVQESLESFTDKADFLNKLHDETHLSMDFPFKEMESFSRQFASDPNWQRICQKNQITAKDISQFSSLQDRLAKEVEPVFLAEKRLAEDPTNPQLQSQLRKAYVKHEPAIRKTLKEIQAGRERFSNVFKSFEDFKALVDKRLENVAEKEMENEKELLLPQQLQELDKYERKKLAILSEKRSFETQKSLLQRVNFREAYNGQLDILNSVSKKLASPLSSEKGAATYHLTAPNASSSSPIQTTWQKHLKKSNFSLGDLRSFSSLFSRFQSLLSPLKAAQRDMETHPGDTKKEKVFQRLKEKNEKEIESLKREFDQWGGKERFGSLILMHENYLNELRETLPREEAFALGHLETGNISRFNELRKEVNRLENMDLFTTMDEQVKFLDSLVRQTPSTPVS